MSHFYILEKNSSNLQRMIVVQIYIYNMLHLNIQSPFKHIEHIFLLIMNTAHGDIE
jgi:hypothetical protein